MDNELKTNAVSLSPEEQYQIRKSIVRLWKQGKSNSEIVETLDANTPARAYREAIQEGE